MSERSLYSDRFMELVPRQMGLMLDKYFGFPARRFHIALLERMFLGGKLVVNWPTDHGKSFIASQFFPILSLAHNPDESHIICNANIQDAKRRLEWIATELETNYTLLADFPWLKPPSAKKGNWTKTEITVTGRSQNKPNPSVVATAIKSSDVRGRRGKLIMDDVEGTDSEHSAVKRQELMDFIGREAFRCYESANESKRPLLIALGTPMHVDSVYFALSANPEFEYFRFPAWQDDRDIPNNVCPDCGEKFKMYDVQGKKLWGCYVDGWFRDGNDHFIKYLWADKAPKVIDFRNSLDKQYFAVQMLLDPRAGDASKLSLGDIKKLMGEGEFGADQWKTFVALDGAGGSRTRWADYAGIAVVQIHWAPDEKLPRLRVLEAHKYPDGIYEQVRMASGLAHTYSEDGKGPCPVIYDSNAMQGSIYADVFRHLHPEIKLIPHFTGRGQKYDDSMGITILRTLVRDRRIEVPEEILDTTGVKALQQEIRDLGDINAHDHICSAIWFVIRHMFSQARFYNVNVVNGYEPRFAIQQSRSFSGRNFAWEVKV